MKTSGKNRGNAFPLQQTGYATKLITGALLSLAFTAIHAQNTSYNVNNNPINGSNCAALGWQALQNNAVTDANNTAVGHTALSGNNGGSDNTAIGASALSGNTAGNNNCAFGYKALNSNSTGNNNLGIGTYPLYTNTTGSANIGIGDSALYKNTTGYENIGIGEQALLNNNGWDNLAIGPQSLTHNTSGVGNIGLGSYALFKNNTGQHNVVIGTSAMSENTSGLENTACGSQALELNTTGDWNTAVASEALFSNTTGSANTACGYAAFYNNTTGYDNSALGLYADVSSSNLHNSTSIGANAIVNASNKVRIGDVNVTVIQGQVAFTNPSDGRFKTNIKEEDVKGLDFILKLRPVVYNFDTRKFTEFLTKNMSEEHRKDYLNDDFKASTAVRQSGFIAQEVEKAAQDVAYDFNGLHKPEDDNDNYSIAYSQFVVPLVKGMQEQQKMIVEQKESITKLEQEVADQKELNKQLLAKLGMSTGLNQVNGNDNSFNMEQNEPNPFTNETLIKYNLPQSTTNAYLAVFDLSGKQVATFPINQKGAGSISITSDKLSAGIYLYSIVANGKALATKRMMVAEK